MGTAGVAVGDGLAVGSGVVVGLGVWGITLASVGSICGDNVWICCEHPVIKSIADNINRSIFWGVERYTGLFHASPGDHTGTVKFIPF
jgi:hypothetical protein